jgi:hypothetical protein
VHAATYELEFREVLVLYHQRSRVERQQQADELERMVMTIRSDALIRGVHSEKAARELNDLLSGLFDQVRSLREPLVMEEEPLTPEDIAFLSGAYRPGV